MRIDRILIAAAAMFSFSVVAHAEGPPPQAAAAGVHEAAPVPPPPAAGAHDAVPAEKTKATDDPDPSDHHPTKYEVGINVQKMTKLELGPGTFDADFLVSYRCSEAPCDPHMQLFNGEIKGKPDKIVDDKLHKVYRVKAELTAGIDVSQFPFDQHTLAIDLGDRDEADVTFTANTKDAPEPTDIKIFGWDVMHGDAEVTSEDLGEGLKASHYVYGVTVRRPVLAAVAKNFLPALTMVFVLFIALIMRPKMAPARLAAGTGSFVAVIMFHNTAAAQLPPLAFFTLLDKFMFSLYVLWLVHIVFSVLILRSEDQKDEKASDKLYRTALIAVPVLAVVEWAIVFSKIV